jgi:DMSO/TMAO reductase YedYZ molybdopterin-dependent catalytic subunit
LVLKAISVSRSDYWFLKDIINEITQSLLCLELAVLLISISVLLVSERTHEQQNAPMSLPETTAEATPAKTTLLPAGTSLEEELKQYEEYLAKLVELKLSGQISDNAYQALKEDYKVKIEELIKKKLQTNIG